MSPGIPPGCSERERVNGAITTRCFNFSDPRCTDVNSFMPFFLFINPRVACLVGALFEVSEPGVNQHRFSDFMRHGVDVYGMIRSSRSFVSCRLKLSCVSMQSAKPALRILIVLWIVSSPKLSIQSTKDQFAICSYGVACSR